MPRIRILMIASVAAVLAAGAASAQQTMDPANVVSAPSDQPTNVAMAPMNGAMSSGDDAMTPSSRALAMASADQQPGQVNTIASGDKVLLTNGPIPDTAANRARYGEPLSHAGKRSAPVGN